MTPIPKNRPFKDVPRLLQMRSEIQGKKIGEYETSAVTAFLAWRAFLIVARQTEVGKEKDVCEKKIEEMLKQHNELKEVTEKFVKSLKPLIQQSENVVKDWYCDIAQEPQYPFSVDTIRQKIKKMNEAFTHPEGWKGISRDITYHAYAIRNCVLAHGTMHSTGNLFQSIMPAFDNFVASIACAGYATQSKITFNEAKEECHV